MALGEIDNVNQCCHVARRREIQPRFGRREGKFRKFSFVGNFQASNKNSVIQTRKMQKKRNKTPLFPLYSSSAKLNSLNLKSNISH